MCRFVNLKQFHPATKVVGYLAIFIVFHSVLLLCGARGGSLVHLGFGGIPNKAKSSAFGGCGAPTPVPCYSYSHYSIPKPEVKSSPGAPDRQKAARRRLEYEQ